MKLTIDDFRKIVFGTAEVLEDEEGFFVPQRFTAAQRELYRRYRSNDMYRKTMASAGVRLSFATDAEHLSFEYRFKAGSSRPFGYFDLYENGILTAHFGGADAILADGHANLTLSKGEKNVELYFPWSKVTHIGNVCVDDSAVLKPCKRGRRMLFYGDSITHGYDAMFPSLSYASKLALALDADALNKAVGGDTFFPELLEAPDNMSPAVVVAAYGTNDWKVHTKDRFELDCRTFYERLCRMYPSAKIIAVTPLWRADGQKETKFGYPHTEIAPTMHRLLDRLPLTVIDGYPLTPHTEEFYSDRNLHPNDLGFSIYTDRLLAEIRKVLS